MAGAFTHNGNVVEGLPSIASQINYSNTSSGMQATQVQAAIDELNTNKQPKTDNNLTTTSKETTGAINELKSGLNDVNSNISTLSSIVNGITYGSTANPLNIDTISGMYYYLCVNDGGLSGDLPITLLGGGSTFLLIGFSHNVTYGYGYGVQMAIDFTDSSIAIRNSAYNSGSWGAWRKIASSAS